MCKLRVDELSIHRIPVHILFSVKVVANYVRVEKLKFISLGDGRKNIMCVKL